MAKRPVFVPYSHGSRLVREIMIDFKWNPGFAPVQKKKNIVALHEAAVAKGLPNLLEVSTKSEDELGRRLSAFNLKIDLDDGEQATIECAFQGSKVFENGGPFTDLYGNTSRKAKKDERLKSCGRVIGFRFGEYEFPSEPKTAFYDWLYARALAPHKKFLELLESYDGFTDIEFNPAKSINCQARSCALFVSLVKKDILEYAISSPEMFIEVVSPDSYSQPYSDDVRQGRLL